MHSWVYPLAVHHHCMNINLVEVQEENRPDLDIIHSLEANPERRPSLSQLIPSWSRPMSKKEQLCQAAESQSVFVCSITVPRSDQSGYWVQSGDALSLHDSIEHGSIHFPPPSWLQSSLGLSWKWRLRLYSLFAASQKHLRESAAAFEGPSRELASYHTTLAGQLHKAEPHSSHHFQTLPSETLQYWDGCTSNCHVISVSEEF